MVKKLHFFDIAQLGKTARGEVGVDKLPKIPDVLKAWPLRYNIYCVY